MTARILFLFTIVLSLMSQFPAVLDSGADAILKLVWMLPLGYLALTSPVNYVRNSLLPYYIFLFFFALYCVSLQLFTGKSYVGVDLTNMAISMMVAIVSYNIWRGYGNDYLLRVMSLAILLCCSVLAVNIYLSDLRNENLITDGYAFVRKNAIAPLLLCCATIALRHLSFQGKYKFLVYGLVGWCLLVMILMRSRATLVAAVFMLAYVLLMKSNFKQKIACMAIAMGAVLFLYFSTDFTEILYKGIILGGRDASDLDSLSSGRFTLVSICLTMIPDHPWIGNGNIYLDCMPIAMVLQYGALGAAIVFIFLIVIYSQLKKISKTTMGFTAYILFLSFIINSLFEAQPPFGSGMRCFLLWVMYGFGLAEYDKQKIENVAVVEQNSQ